MTNQDVPLFARQAIYDSDCIVSAFELLFRPTDDNFSFVDNNDEASGDRATSNVLSQFFANSKFDEISDNKQIYINFTRNNILDGIPLLLPKGKIVVEVLEDMIIDEYLISALRNLKTKGYTIALDDYVYSDENSCLIDFADIIKIDVMDKKQEQIQQELNNIRNFNGLLLAEKIENEEQFSICKSLGFTFFQGYFLNKPKIIIGHLIGENKTNVLKLLSLLQDPDVDFDDIKKLVTNDPKLSYRILLISNSAAVNPGSKITSITDSLVRLGLRRVKDWVSLLLLSGLEEVPTDLIETTIIRAKMCEVISMKTSLGDPLTSSTVGLLSTLAAILKIPMEDILSKINLSKEIDDALLNHVGELGDILKMVQNFEKGNLSSLDITILSFNEYSSIYTESLIYGRNVIKSLGI